MTSHVRTLTETSSISDTLVDTLGLTRVLPETSTIADVAMTRHLSMTRTFIELPTQIADVVSEDDIQPRIKPQTGIWRLTNKETMG